MMPRNLAWTYRSIVRELAKSSIFPRESRNKAITASFRTIFEKRSVHASPADVCRDLSNAVTFMHSQRTYKELLDRYNPLVDLTAEERIEATARRVGLNMPVSPEGDNKGEGGQ